MLVRDSMAPRAPPAPARAAMGPRNVWPDGPEMEHNGRGPVFYSAHM